MISKMFKNYRERTEKHIENVEKIFITLFKVDKVKEYFEDMGIDYGAMFQLIEKHDSSKFGMEEMLGYILMTEKYGRKVGYRFSKEDEDIMKKAWDHHKSVNRHHPEFFDNDLSNMEYKDIIEMVCDWGAMSLEFGDSLVSFKEEKAYPKYKFTDSQRVVIDFLCEKIEKEVLKKVGE